MKVLLAVDGSAHALEAARALSILPVPGPPTSERYVEIVSVMNPPEVALTAQSELWYPQFLEHQQEMTQAALSAAQSVFEGTNWHVTTRQETGHVGHTLTELAEDSGVDLIVVGAKGHSTIERVLLGSVSDYVATHARCSVLVVRPPGLHVHDQQHAAEAGNTARVHWKQISVAIDTRPASKAVLEHLCRYHWNEEQTVTVLTASVKLEVFREDILATAMEEAAQRRTEALRCAEAATEQLKTCGGNLAAETVETDHIGEGLLQAAQSHHSDLIVLGDSGRGPVTRFLLGSTSRYVLRHAHCSVLVVRGHWHDDEDAGLKGEPAGLPSVTH